MAKVIAPVESFTSNSGLGLTVTRHFQVAYFSALNKSDTTAISPTLPVNKTDTLPATGQRWPRRIEK